MSNLDKKERFLVPPLNFAIVAPKVYRSGHPNKKNFEFLSKLKLKTIMYLAPDDYDTDVQLFAKQNQINIVQHKIKGNKEPFGEIDPIQIRDALLEVLDIRNHPILIHCNKGKYRIGCLIGCLRKLQDWSLTSIFDEYNRFAGNTIRIADQEFIEVFNEIVPHDPKYIPFWLK